VHVVGEHISRSELGAFLTPKMIHTDIPFFKAPVPQRQRVKWLAGVDMNRAFKNAARRGLEDVKSLLRVAGNDAKTVSRITSLTQLMSKLAVV